MSKFSEAKAISDSKLSERMYYNKYGELLDEIKSAEQTLNSLMLQGGARYLELKENKDEINQTVLDLGLNAGIDHEADLEGKLDLINKKIEMISGSKNQGDWADQAKTQETSNSVGMDISTYISMYIDEFSYIYNNSTSMEQAKSNIEKRKEESEKLLKNTIKKLTESLKTNDNDDDKADLKTAQQQILALNSSYSIMMTEIEKASQIKAKKEAEIVAACEESAKEEFDDLPRLDSLALLKAQEAIAKKLAKLPQEIVDQFDKINAILYQIVTGFTLNIPSLKRLSPKLAMPTIDDLIAQITALLNPVFKTFDSISVPAPPIVSPIMDIMSMMTGDGPSGDFTDEQLEKIKKYKDSFKIPTAWKDSLISMKDTIMITMMTLPTLLIQLIFNMIDTIVGLFKQIAGILGVPSIPWPLSLVPDCIDLMPKLLKLMKILPMAMWQIVEGKFKELGAKMMACGEGFVNAISNVSMPEIGGPTVECPQALKKKFEQKYAKVKAEKIKQREEEQKKLEEQAKKLQESIKTADESQKQTFKNQLSDLKKSMLELGQSTGTSKEDYEREKLATELKNAATGVTVDIVDPVVTVANNPTPSLTIDDDELVENEEFAD